MAGGEGGSAAAAVTRSLQETPTWALATVCFVFISFSIFIEHLIHLICHWLKKHRKTALFEAVEKLKSVLMLLGFMSLTLAVAQRGIAKICISTKVADTMLPCQRMIISKTTKSLGSGPTWVKPVGPIERRLASGADSNYCSAKGMTPLISQEGLNQLSTFIFVLAVMQIVYSVVTMALGRAKMSRWKAWEKETQTVEYQAANDPNRFRFTRQTTFVNRHGGHCTETSIQLWIKCFLRQFFHSVKKVDYLTLRHGFISEHLSSSNKSFDFQNYIHSSLEDDFKVVVGINPYMWLLVVIFLLVDVHGWEAYLWVSFIPLTIVLVVGTKLEVIVAKMALQLRDQNIVIKGAPVVQPNDNLFWFSHPKYVLTFLHFTLFMNAFEIAFFVWVTLQYGIHSCYHEHLAIIIIRVVLAVAKLINYIFTSVYFLRVTVQVMCSYITLPLYALVTQMGSHYKAAVLEQHTAKAIKQWHAGVRQKRKKESSSHYTQESSSHYTRESSSSHRTQETYSPRHSYSTGKNNINLDDQTSSDVSYHRRNPTFADIVPVLDRSDNHEITEVTSQESTVLQIIELSEIMMTTRT